MQEKVEMDPSLFLPIKLLEKVNLMEAMEEQEEI